MKYPIHYDVLVVGGGHAGVEAACAAARMGARTLLLTHNIETIGQMSCNPAIGGIGKGHLVKEIDALGGIMARAADRAGIQWRILNRRKGPAVRATRAQADRILYKAAVREIVENQPNLDIFQTPVTDLILEGTRIAGVKSQHQIDYYATATVLTAGTFLGGKIHVGLNSFAGGRAGDPPANELAARLHDLPFALARMKTGTPPRLDARTVDYSRMEAQPGDTPLPVFSYLGNAAEHPRQVACHITRTNERTHDIIRAYIDQAPMYAGVIKDAFGPRYCPSIEDKVMRFADKDSHQIFIEPESLTTNELYPNGVSTSLPFAAPIAYIQTTPASNKRASPVPATPSNTTTSTRNTSNTASKAAPSTTSTLPAKSTAPPATKKRARKACWQASTPPAARATSNPGTPNANKPTSASSSTTSSPRAHANPTACSPAVPNTACCCAKTTPTRA